MSIERCCNCCRELEFCDEIGESGLYSSVSYTLCGPCWLEEEKLIEEQGTNNIPSRIAHYRSNS